jgi:hypothetical protein
MHVVSLLNAGMFDVKINGEVCLHPRCLSRLALRMTVSAW